MTKRIVVAPAGTRFSPEAGSEDGWIYDIVAGVATIEPDLRFTCISERTDGPMPDRVRAVGIGRRRTEELGGLMLPFRMLHAATVARSFDDVALLHHALPFAVNRSFSALGARARRRGVPVIIGPVQTPLEWVGPDEVGGSLARDSQGLVRRAVTAGAAAAEPLAQVALARLSGRTVRQADRVVVVGDPARTLVHSLGVDPERIACIPPPTRVAVRAAAEGGAGWGPLRLVTAGYLIERKALDDLVTVVADLACAGEEVTLDVAGDGPAAPQLHGLARRHRCAAAIRFHGWLEPAKLAQLFDGCDVYVSTSRAESWGQAIADALAAGLMAVSAANVGAKSMAELGAPLRLVPVGDRQGLADELRRLCRTDPTTRRAAATAGARWAAQHVAAPVVAARWAELYAETIDGVRRRTTARTAGGGLP